MRNPVAWMRWLVVLIAVGLAALFVYRVILPDLEAPPAPSPSVEVSPSAS